MYTAIELKPLHNGVSQQTPFLRLASQASEQINAVSIYNRGVVKRPPAIFINKITNISYKTNLKYVDLAGLDDGLYTAIIDSTNKTIEIINKEGVKQNVNIDTNVLDYIENASNNNLKIINTHVNNYLINSEKIVLADTSLTSNVVDANTQTVIFTLLKINYDIINIPINIERKLDKSSGLTEVDIDMDTGTTAANINEFAKIFKDEFLKTLKKHFNARKNPTPNANFNDFIQESYVVGNLVIIKYDKRYGVVIHESVTGLVNQPDVITITGTDVTDISKLPASYKVSPDVKNPPTLIAHVRNPVVATTNVDFAGYWVKSTPEGVWQETTKRGSHKGLNYDTLPILIEQKSNGEWHVKQPEWRDRIVGNEHIDSNPNVSFVNRTIVDGLFTQERLIFVTSNSWVASVAGDYHNFYRTTLTSYLESDIIDIDLNTNEYIKSISQFGIRLLLLTNNSQYVIDYKNNLSYKNISITNQTNFSSNSNIKPLAINNSIFFFNSNSSSTNVYEYKKVGDEAFTGLDVTQNIPTYISNDINNACACSELNTIYILNKENKKIIYVYTYTNNQNEYTQMSWAKWKFTFDIENIQIKNDVLYLIQSFNKVLFFSKIELANRNIQNDIVNLDNKILIKKENVTYSQETRQSTFIIPPDFYTLDKNIKIVSVNRNIDFTVAKIDTTSNSVTIIGEIKSDVVLGYSYLFTYICSTVYRRANETIHLNGELLLQSALIYNTNTTELDVVLYNTKGVQQSRRAYYNVVLDLRNSEFDTLNFNTEITRTAMQGDNKNTLLAIESNTPYHLELNSIIIEGLYENRTSTKLKRATASR